jgi:hypothetical protein
LIVIAFGTVRAMNLDHFIDDLRRRLLTEEPDQAIRSDIRDLITAYLQERGPSLSYCTKYALSRAIAALRWNALKPGSGLAHPRLRFALLQFELALVDEDDRDLSHLYPNEMIDALTQDMLLDAAIAVP